MKARWKGALLRVALAVGFAIAKRTYRAYRGLLHSPRWQRAFNAGGAASAAPVGQHGN
jgi:hypothetical protein